MGGCSPVCGCAQCEGVHSGRVCSGRVFTCLRVCTVGGCVQWVGMQWAGVHLFAGVHSGQVCTVCGVHPCADVHPWALRACAPQPAPRPWHPTPKPLPLTGPSLPPGPSPPSLTSPPAPQVPCDPVLLGGVGPQCERLLDPGHHTPAGGTPVSVDAGAPGPGQGGPPPHGSLGERGRNGR